MTVVTQRTYRLWHSWNIRAGVGHELPTVAVLTK